MGRVATLAACAFTAALAARGAAAKLPTIFEIVHDNKDFSILKAAIEVTGLEPDLDSCRFGPVTYVGTHQSFGGTWSACVDEGCTWASASACLVIDYISPPLKLPKF
jgi:hypothetical protein